MVGKTKTGVDSKGQEYNIISSDESDYKLEKLPPNCGFMIIKTGNARNVVNQKASTSEKRSTDVRYYKRPDPRRNRSFGLLKTSRPINVVNKKAHACAVNTSSDESEDTHSDSPQERSFRLQRAAKAANLVNRYLAHACNVNSSNQKTSEARIADNKKASHESDSKRAELPQNSMFRRQKASAGRSFFDKEAQEYYMDSGDESDYNPTRSLKRKKARKPAEKLESGIKSEVKKTASLDKKGKKACVVETSDDEEAVFMYEDKYLLQERRVHATNDRPLKCPWMGCEMAFKWQWARTEHMLRVHTGAQRYVYVHGEGIKLVTDHNKTGHVKKLF